MRQTKNCRRGRLCWACLLGWSLTGLVVFFAATVQAQEPSLVVGNVIPVTDPLGRPFKGINGSPEISSRVEIRATFDGGILSPTNEEAQLDFFNPLMRVSYIGHDVPIPDSGLFSETFVSNELHSATSYYARVFGPSRDTSIYYADSQPFAGMKSGTINPEFGALTLTGPDEDGDGLPDAWEWENGLNPGEPDTDGDGYDDWFEVFYGNDEQRGNPDPPLEVQIQTPAESGEDVYTVSWWTIPFSNMRYQLQFRPQMAVPGEEDGHAFSNIWSGTATDDHLVIDVQDWVGTNEPPKGFFRVRVPYEGP